MRAAHARALSEPMIGCQIGGRPLDPAVPRRSCGIAHHAPGDPVRRGDGPARGRERRPNPVPTPKRASRSNAVRTPSERAVYQGFRGARRDF